MNARSLVKKVIPLSLFHKVEPYGHFLEAVTAQTMAGFPAKDIKFIGVTGTNGKTSTSFMIQRMLHEAGYKVGLMTTVAYGVGDDIKPQIAHMTTAGPKVLLDRIKKMKADGAEWIVLETTSHALAQRRVWGIPYAIAVFTNLTHEHLDYHGTFERYRDAKRLLFKQTNANKQGLRTGIVNAEDPSAEHFASDVRTAITYGLKKGDIQARNIKLTAGGSRYTAVVDGEEYRIECHLPGSFNVANSLAAVGVGRALGLTKQQIEKGIAALTRVEGRMDPIDEGQDFSVIVDYAHTPDSFEKLFKDLRPVVKGKLIVLFGSAGRRDEAKRTTQGQLAGKYADEVIVTEEDDRDIDGMEIMDQIAKGAESEGKVREKDLFLVHDRPEAIRFAFERAKKDDVVLLLGKGHEKDILRNGPRAAELRHLPQDDHNPERVIEIPWDEITVAREILSELLHKKD
jgi:UDP-N-acetylmuramoyl-L-alanyl-D-glutamate--2,6-diaminopimelate ligase